MTPRQQVDVITMGSREVKKADLLRTYPAQKGAVTGVVRFRDGATKYVIAAEGSDQWVTGTSDDWIAEESQFIDPQ